jgi:hypothetical protein
MLYFLSVVCIAAAVALWLMGDKKNNRFRKGLVPGESISMVEDHSLGQIGNEIRTLQAQYSGLPAVPINPLQYDGWIEEVRKRMQLRSLGLTIAQETTLQNQLNGLQAARVAGIQTEAQLQNALSDLAIVKRSAKQRAESADQIQARQAQLDLLKIDAEIARLQKDLDAINNPPKPAPAPTRESREERYFAEWRRLQEQRKRRLAECNGDPKSEDAVNRYFDDEEERFKEGR